MKKSELKAIIREAIKDELKEAGSIGGAIDMSSMNDTWIAPKREKNKNQGVYLQKFSSTEARKIVDGALQNWVKDLRKSQHRIIKDWMNAAKAGQIDFFDLIRGLKTGEMGRMHPYEMDFLVSILTKDKIIDRFRSYFNGKKGKKRN